MGEIEFELDDRSASCSPQRALMAAALLAWVSDILAEARHDETKPGPWLRRFKRWTPDDMPARWILFCEHLGLDPWVVVVRLWRQIAEQRDNLAHKDLVREAITAGFSKPEAEQWAELNEASAA